MEIVVEFIAMQRLYLISVIVAATVLIYTYSKWNSQRLTLVGQALAAIGFIVTLATALCMVATVAHNWGLSESVRRMILFIVPGACLILLMATFNIIKVHRKGSEG